ncbi:hypothetical protein LOK49_LG05G01704 [Camellia lanceoleosa]|uniref:Uncharacterized protein n=1 Tax=Camellia lanceoleosa TaxID=1840588 RepID=A0ACC0HTB8_9ERIC|nr:hypothetical protein LOK49_LG05G01704 [Camellia lanceoleosa]
MNVVENSPCNIFHLQKQVIKQVEVEYVPEKAEFDGHLDEEFRKVFEKFNFKEIVGSEEKDKKDETAANSASKKVDSDFEEDEQDTHQQEKADMLVWISYQAS